jgi:cell division protein FtsI (penicillin-binding protein 3)
MLIAVFKTFAIQFEGRTTVFDTNNGTAEKMPTRSVNRTPRRGQILDENYTPLVTSVSFYDIHMDPTVVKQELFDQEINELCQQLALYFPEKNAPEYNQYIRSARLTERRYLLIRRNATIEERKIIRSFPIFREGRLKGGLIDTDEIIIRKRPHGELMKRTLGYYRAPVKNKGELRVGIEGAFNEYLAGEAGEEIEQRYGNGWKKTGQILRESVEGANVVTSISKDIQEVAHSELERQLKLQGARNGSVIVMDVKTGFVKAIVSLTKSSDGNYYESYNHAIGTKEVPGSTFKLASLMAALEDKQININDKVNATGSYKFYDSEMTDHDGGYGIISVKQAFEKSSNVISKVINNAYKGNPEAFIERLRSFGLADSLGLDILGEQKPTLYYPGHSNWSGISVPWMAVGYEVQQTPIQTLAFYNAVANNGKLVKPQFVKEITRGGQVIRKYEPIVLREKICSQNTLTILQGCLEGVVKRGTGKALQSALFTIAGKTGTARILNDNAEYGEKGERKYQASFVGYFPAEDPIYSCIVVIAAPSQDIYGAKVSGTVFSAIANKVYATQLKYHEAINEKKKRLKEVPIMQDGYRNDLEKILHTMQIPYTMNDSKEWLNTFKRENSVELEGRFIGKTTVPNVRGMNAKDAIYLIEKTGMRTRIDGAGKVVSQSVAAGTKVSDRVVILTLN